jgi:hypothetical protein
VPDNSFQGYYITNNIYFIHASDSAGNTIWEKKFLEKFDQGTNKNNFGSATTLAKCTNNLVVSSLQEKSNANPFFVISKIDLSGNLMWYDSSKADIGKKLIAAVDANCNPYLNYEAYAGSPTLHSIIKKYSDVAQAPSSVFNYITNPTSVVYVANKIEIIIDAETIQRCFLVEALGKKIDVSNLSNNKITIYKNELANGVYIAVIQTNKATYCQKIVVQY